MKSKYWQFNGLLDDKLCKYTIILTPHFLDRMVQRGRKIGGTHLRALIPKLWEATIANKVCGTKIINAYIYFRRQFNGRRKRWELELITITPSRVFHTHKLKHAIEVKI